MAFARTAAVAGTGTVSCTSTTTVTGSGTAFAFAIGAAAAANAPRVGGTITVGGVTKTITAITSATSLTVDSAFGTFSGQAFTCQTGITQTGTDTMNLSLGAATGFTITNRGDLFRTFDVGGQDLFIEGTLTVESRVAQLRNDGSCANRFEVLGSATGGEIIFNGRKAAAANAPFPYPGFDWLGQNGNKIMRLRSTNASFPAKFTMVDACVRFGADWLTTDSGNYSTITTSGDVCWMLCARGTGTSQARLRQDNTTASINFTANKTFVGVWLNFGVPQYSIKGYTPVDTDGPEINLASVPTASRIVIEDYLTTYVLPSYYAGVQIVLLGSAWTRLKNNLLGTNIAWRSSSSSGGRFNVLEFSKQITIRAQDTAGNLLSDGYMYYQPTGANVAGIRAKGITSDITFDLTQQAIATVGGAATSEFVFAWGYTTATTNLSSYSYFCTGTTRGSETHTVYSSRYGYDKQSSSVTLSGNNAATPTYVHVSLPTTDKVIANAAAITGVAFNFSTKTITVTGTLTIQQIYDAYQYQLNQTANLQQPDECTVASGQTYYVGWTINNSGTINEGANLTTIRAQTITNTGNIFAIYTDSAGTSTIWKFENISVGSSIIIYDASGVTKYFQQEVTSPGDYSYYIPPGTTGTYTWAIELYGKQRQSGSFAANTGGLLFYEPIYVEDVGLDVTVKATVAAYTAIDTLNKFYDYTAYRRLSEDFIKLGQIATRSGTAVEIGDRNLVVNAAASVMESITGSTITIKSGVLAPGSKYSTIIATPPKLVTAATTEVITASIEDGAGNSSVTIQGGSGNFTLWKLANAVPEADYATGTNLGNVGNTTFRFLDAPGYKIVIVDNVTGYRITCPMDKGVYTRGLFFGSQVQLAQSAEVTQINTKVDILTNNVAALPQEILDSTVETGATVVESLRLHNSVLGAKVSGAGTGIETFRDLADTKDRLISTVDSNGNRLSEVDDLT
jgi:hypothetical protein